MLAAQVAAVVCATLEIALAIIAENTPSWAALQARDSVTTSQPSENSDVTVVAGLIIARFVCSLVWAVGVVTSIYCEHMFRIWSTVRPRHLTYYLFCSASVCRQADLANFCQSCSGLLGAETYGISVPSHSEPFAFAGHVFGLGF
jgi:hypothetical protein